MEEEEEEDEDLGIMLHFIFGLFGFLNCFVRCHPELGYCVLRFWTVVNLTKGTINYFRACSDPVSHELFLRLNGTGSVRCRLGPRWALPLLIKMLLQ